MIKHLAKYLVAATLLAAAPLTRAQYLTDLWYAPDEPGWGLSIQHQANTLFAVFYVYSAVPVDTSGKAAAEWYVASDMRFETVGQLSRYRGTLHAAKGPPHTASFDPAAVQLTEVGEIAITGDTPTSGGSVTYRIGSTQRTKTIRRMSFGRPELAGTYLVTMSGVLSRVNESPQCSTVLPLGLHTRRETWVVAPDGAAGWRVTRTLDDGATSVEPVQVTVRGSKLELRLRIPTAPVAGEGLVVLDAHAVTGWLGSFQAHSDARVTENIGGQMVTTPLCRFDGTFAAARAVGTIP